MKKLSLNTIGPNGFEHSQLLLTMPLDSLFLTETNISNVDFRKEKCLERVIIYSGVGVDENWIVEMAKHAKQTKFLNAKDLLNSEDL